MSSTRLRSQGFPDDYMFVARERLSSSTDKTAKNVASRFKQIGNSVSPPLASMIGETRSGILVFFISASDRSVHQKERAREESGEAAGCDAHSGSAMDGGAIRPAVCRTKRVLQATRKATKPCFFYESGRVETVIEVSDFFDSDLGEDVDTD